jgi:hypothetical protein
MMERSGGDPQRMIIPSGSNQVQQQDDDGGGSIGGSVRGNKKRYGQR